MPIPREILNVHAQKTQLSLLMDATKSYTLSGSVSAAET